ELSALRTYANSGGRVYASHFSYSWLYNNGDYAGTANWNKNQNEGVTNGNTTTDGYIDLVSNPKGNAFQSWLESVGASTAGSNKVPVVVVRHDVDSVIAPTQQWLYRQGTLLTDNRGNTVADYRGQNLPLHFTFNTPPSAASNAQCGRVLFSDFHVH